jgi:hypothetical protein
MIQRLLLLSCFSALFTCGLALHAQNIRTVALSGDPAPGGSIFSDFNSPVINNHGQVAFQGKTTTALYGIWSEGRGNGLAKVTVAGDNAAGTTGTFTGFGDPLLSDSGHTAFRGEINGPDVTGVNSVGIWRDGELAGTELMVRTGDQAAGVASGYSYNYLDKFVLNEAGEIGFLGSVSNTQLGYFGLWSSTSSNDLQLVARNGLPGPGVDEFHSIFFHPTLNNEGQLAFSSGSQGVWKGSPGELESVVLLDDPAPGTDTTFSGLNFGGIIGINNTSQVAFRAYAPSPHARGIWKEENGALELVALTGTHAPGTGVGATFSELWDPVINAQGKTAFQGYLTGPDIDGTNNFGIWSEGLGEGLQLTARAGDEAPGTNDQFSGFGFQPILNSQGQIAFSASLVSQGSFDRGIWAQDITGELQLIVAPSSVIDVDDGPGTDLRTVSSVSFRGNLDNEANSGNQDGRPSPFNDYGQVAFTATFTDGSWGVFVSNAVASLPQLPGDFDGDGDVDGRDFLAWQRNPAVGNLNDWQTHYSVLEFQAVSVPEPDSFLFVIVLGLGLIINRTRME